jgi:L-threonylcarbamoyladenylate synthase
MTIISNCTASALKDAAASLIAGNLVAFPTETVYGLGADASNQQAVARIYEVKGRPTDHPLIVHISSINNLDKWAKDIPEYAVKLARAFWPGPMTLVLKRTDLAKDFITGGQDNVGVRVPSHIVAHTLLEEFESQGGKGIAGPSANRFGSVSPTTAQAVEIELGNFLDSSDKILDGGNCNIGIESTIINCTEKVPRILRPGAITSEMIRSIIREISEVDLISTSRDKIKSTGMFKSHYAPKARILLNSKPGINDGFIALHEVPTPKGAIRLASPKSVEEFAQLLYEAFRDGDKMGLQFISVYLPHDSGVGTAIIDRLNKSAAWN